MGDIVVAMLKSGSIIIGEKTEKGMKDVKIPSVLGDRFAIFNCYQGLVKDDKFEVSEDDILKGSEREPKEEVKMKYLEGRSGLALPKKKLVDLAMNRNQN